MSFVPIRQLPESRQSSATARILRNDRLRSIERPQDLLSNDHDPDLASSQFAGTFTSQAHDIGNGTRG